MKPGPDDALSLAREQFLLPERVDMSTLADELGVNRVTLYRWFGSRDRLLVEVVWSLADGMLSEADRSTRGRGSDRIVRVVGEPYRPHVGPLDRDRRRRGDDRRRVLVGGPRLR